MIAEPSRSRVRFGKSEGRLGRRSRFPRQRYRKAERLETLEPVSRRVLLISFVSTSLQEGQTKGVFGKTSQCGRSNRLDATGIHKAMRSLGIAHQVGWAKQ